MRLPKDDGDRYEGKQNPNVTASTQSRTVESIPYTKHQRNRPLSTPNIQEEIKNKTTLKAITGGEENRIFSTIISLGERGAQAVIQIDLPSREAAGNKYRAPIAAMINPIKPTLATAKNSIKNVSSSGRNAQVDNVNNSEGGFIINSCVQNGRVTAQDNPIFPHQGLERR